MMSAFKKLGGIFKKGFLVVFAFALIVTLFTQFSEKPQTDSPPFSVQEYNRDKIYSYIENTDTTTDEGKLMVATYKTITCMSMGEACTDNPADGDTRYKDSLFGSLGNLLTFTMVNPPASGVEYVYDGLQNAGILPQVYAAEGVGFASIKPLIPIWRIFRDIAYLVIVMVMVVIGFLIMFRMKLDSQTAIGIQNSLPKIVISLLLITFSFPIAGFLIDLMYLFMAISISMIANPAEVGRLQNEYMAATPAQIFDGAVAIKEVPVAAELIKGINPGWSTLVEIWPLPFKFASTILTVGGVAYSILGILPGVVTTLLSIVGGIGTLLLTEMIMNTLGTAPDAVQGIGGLSFNLGGLISGSMKIVFILVLFVLGLIFMVPILMMVLIFFTIVLLFFRVFFMLFTSYLKILLLVIFGPLYMLMEALPGQETASTWFKNLVGELLSFPIVAILLIVANKLGEAILSTVITSTVRDFSDLENAQQFFSPPFLYGLNQEAYAFLISMGIVFLIPEIVKMVKELIGVKDTPFNVGLGTFFAGGTTAVAGGLGLISQFSTLQQSLFGDNKGLLSRLKGSATKLAGDKGQPVKVHDNGTEQPTG